MEELGGAPLEFVESSDWPRIMRLYWQKSAREQWETNQERIQGGQFGEKVGKKLGEKVGEKTGEKVGESLGEIHKLKPSSYGL